MPTTTAGRRRVGAVRLALAALVTLGLVGSAGPGAASPAAGRWTPGPSGAEGVPGASPAPPLRALPREGPAWPGAAVVGPDGVRLTLVATDEFDRLSYRWTRYRGRPGGDPGGWWEPSHVSVQDGLLVLTGSRDVVPGTGGRTVRYVSGGVKLEHGVLPLRYGRADVRFRAEPGPYALAILLWPASNTWPPEIDFVEDNGGDRSLVTATLHTGPASRRRAVRATTAVDFTTWHTASVTWSPGRVVYLLDGQTWAVTDDPGVPSAGMRLVVQQQAWPCHHGWYEVCPTPTTPPNHVYVDWVKVWSR